MAPNKVKLRQKEMKGKLGDLVECSFWGKKPGRPVHEKQFERQMERKGARRT